MDKLGSVAILDAGAQYGKVSWFFFVVFFFYIDISYFIKFQKHVFAL